MSAYHEAVGKPLDTAVPEGGGGELEITEVAAVNPGGQRHGVVNQVHHNGRSGEAE